LQIEVVSLGVLDDVREEVYCGRSIGGLEGLFAT